MSIACRQRDWHPSVVSVWASSVASSNWSVRLCHVPSFHLVFLFVFLQKKDLICKRIGRLDVLVHMSSSICMWSLNWVVFELELLLKLLGVTFCDACYWSCIFFFLYLQDCSFWRGCNVQELFFLVYYNLVLNCWHNLTYWPFGKCFVFRALWVKLLKSCTWI